MTRFLLLSLLLMLSGCQSAMQVLEGVDAGCADVNLEGYATDSRATGRIMKIPEDATFNKELVDALCPE